MDTFKISIEAVDNPNNTINIDKVYLTQISDQFTPSWDTISYIGRPIRSYIYTGV